MINVTYDGRERLTVDGHAGTDEKGKDIVCAGVSGIIIALDGAVTDRGLSAVREAWDGHYAITAEESAAEFIIKTAVSGLKRIAKMYPEAVSFS